MGTGAERKGHWSAEIQALRAVAVLLVVLFHVFGGAVGGGYIGVDVFFVISGFLITGHILRDTSSGRFSLARFYGRRARRLLPAALLVLVTTMAVVRIATPATVWVPTAQQVIAAALYAENWVLAAQHVDYLHPVITPTAVQHYWSLSVEEQFYLLWPPAVLLGLRIERRRRSPHALPLLLAAILAASLASAVIGTLLDQDGVYFFSTARAWQFAAGGLVAVLARRVGAFGRIPRPLAALLTTGGLAAIVACGFRFTAGTPVPGVPAMIPVAGAVAVLLGSLGPGRSVRPLEWWPLQWLGDVSYSLYLWHWPVVVLLPVVLGTRGLDPAGRAGALVLSLMLAGLTRTVLEDAPRHATPAAATALVSLGMAAALGLSWMTWAGSDRTADVAQLAAVRALAGGTPCFGADFALHRPRCHGAPLGRLVTPTPQAAPSEIQRTPVWRQCFHRTLRPCVLGPDDPERTVVLFGDSHALAWYPALRVVANRSRWRIVTYLRSGCPPNPLPIRPRTAGHDAACADWARRAIREIAARDDVDLVLTTAFNINRWRPIGRLGTFETGVWGYRSGWAALLRSGVKHVAAIRDNPRPKDAFLECVATSGPSPRCGRPEVRGGKDPLLTAVREARDPAISALDFSGVFCPGVTCPAVMGNVLVYVDDNHLSPTFSTTLGPELGRRLSKVLD